MQLYISSLGDLCKKASTAGGENEAWYRANQSSQLPVWPIRWHCTHRHKCILKETVLISSLSMSKLHFINRNLLGTHKMLTFMRNNFLIFWIIYVCTKLPIHWYLFYLICDIEISLAGHDYVICFYQTVTMSMRFHTNLSERKWLFHVCRNKHRQ